MQRQNDHREMVAGARRRRLLGELATANTAIYLCAPAGYGKSTFARLLRANGFTAPVFEERCLRTPAQSEGRVLIGPADLAFDDAELDAIFSATRITTRDMDHVRNLTQGWPVGAFYLRRLFHLGTLAGALNDLHGAAYDDLFEYVEEQVFVPATQSEREDLLLAAACEPAGSPGNPADFVNHAFVAAAIRARHADDVAECANRTADALARSGAERELLARLPLAALLAHPALWLEASDLRLDRLGAIAFLSEAAAMFKRFEHAPMHTVKAGIASWLARAHGLAGNTSAAIAACDRAIAECTTESQSSELRRLRERLESQMGVGASKRSTHATGERHLRIDLFHGRAVRGNEEVPLTQREAAVLFTLAATPAGALEPARLVDTLWPELDAQKGYAALKVAISRLRTRLGNAGLVRFTSGTYQLGDAVIVDLHELSQALDEYECRDDGCNLTKFLPLLDASRPPRLREAGWFAPIESRLVSSAHRLSHHLAERAIDCGDARAVLHIGHALLAADPYDEEGCTLVVRAHLMEGRTIDAQAAYERFAVHLRSEMGCQPSITFDAIARA